MFFESKYITGTAFLLVRRGERLNSKRSARVFKRRVKQVENLRARVDKKISQLEDLINGLSLAADSDRTMKSSRSEK